MLLNPLPFSKAERVTNVMETWKGQRGGVAGGMFADLRRGNRSFERLGAVRYSSMNLAQGDEE